MGDFLDSASKILAQSQWRVETAGHNLANGATWGYKRRIAYIDLANSVQSNAGPISENRIIADVSTGKTTETGRKSDLAILGEGYFAVRGEGDVYFTRHGQFSRDGRGRLVTPTGLALQLADGGDLQLKGEDFTVTADGMVLEGGEPVGRLALLAIPVEQLGEGPAGGLFLSRDGEVEPVENPSLRQGALETSNVTMGEEMVVMMEALRRAESAQRLVNVYDELLGRAISSFGQT